jgi:exopolysaccharide biosynthesis polyprenyl glycosylphosphotransferase
MLDLRRRLDGAMLGDAGRVVLAVLPIEAVAATADHSPRRQALLAIAVGLLWVLCLRIGRSVGGPALHALGTGIGVARGVVLAVFVTTTLSAWAAGLRLPPWPVAFAGLITFAGTILWDATIGRRMIRVRRLLIVGSGPAVLDLVREIRFGRDDRFDVIGVVHDVSEPPYDGGATVLGPLSDLGAVVGRERPDIVVLAPGPNRPDTFAHLLEAAEAGFRVVELAQFYEHAYGRVPVRDLTRAWFMSVLHLYQRPYSRFAKRSVDLLGAGLILVLTLPLWPVVALFVRRTPGPVILRQRRLGEHGRVFTIYKFRTMVVGAERPGTAVWSQTEDPRVTQAGRVIRRLRLDELPQLWNVVRGDMSLVGPRPERPEFLDELSATVPFWTRRLLVRPGLTGWAQVRHGYAASADETASKLSYDLWYIRHRSLTVDIAICLQTLAVVLRGDRLPSVKAAPRVELESV